MQGLKLCSGLALLESLVAMLVLAAGVLGMLWTHQQTLVLQRQQIARDNAMRVADNMAQRMLTHTTSAHALSWTAPALPSQPTCVSMPCTDNQWVIALRQQAHEELKDLPMGDMAITPLPTMPNGWAITVAWQDPYETFRTDNAWGTPSCPVGKSCWRLVFRTH